MYCDPRVITCHVSLGWVSGTIFDHLVATPPATGGPRKTFPQKGTKRELKSLSSRLRERGGGLMKYTA